VAIEKRSAGNSPSGKQINYKFSGHETFPCRYAWLPKACRALGETPLIFSDEEQAMVKLGVGKNMVRAIRFWVQATGIARPAASGGYEITDLGHWLLSPKDGLDPFLEDRRTLWLLHWKLSTNANDPLFAWNYLLNRWPHLEFTRTEVLEVFRDEARRLGRGLSVVTLEQHFDVFLHTYVPTRGRKGEIQEENLDCPLVELEFIERAGERQTANGGRHEAIYKFRREPRLGVTPQLFVFCIDDYWKNRRRTEQTLSFRDISIGQGGPGQVFKLTEQDVRERLEALASDSKGAFEYQESASVQRIIRKKTYSEAAMLRDIYAFEASYA